MLTAHSSQLTGATIQRTVQTVREMEEFFGHVGTAVRSRRGAVVHDMMLFDEARRAAVTRDGGQGKVVQRAARFIPPPFDKIVGLHVVSLHAEQQGQAREAYDAVFEAMEILYKMLNDDEKNNWWLPILDVMAGRLRETAILVDAASGEAAGKYETCSKAASLLTTFFRAMVIDRSAFASSKKKGILFVVIHLFKIYFRINNLRLCNNLIRTVDSPNFPPLHNFPVSQTVSYHYYIGRLKIFDEHYDEAEVALSEAFRRCSRHARRNKRRILQFLVPIKLLLGKFPQERLLEKYELFPFVDLVRSIRQGSVALFNTALDSYQEYYIRKGIFLLLEKLKILVYRNLVRKVHAWNQNNLTEKQNQLQLSTVKAALRVNGEEMDDDELECILANLIYKNYVKGYIAHKRCVVMSKQTPFPPLALVAGT